MPKDKKTEQIEEKVKKTAKKAHELELTVYNIEGREEERVALHKEIFDTEINHGLLSQSVRVFLVNQRQGNASTKTRGEVNGTTKKVYRQKGTGRARHGSAKGPIFVGGGVTGGPHPHAYSLKMNKKQKRKALYDALTLKYKEGNIIGLFDKLLDIEPKTKNLVDLLKKLKLKSEKILLIIPENKKSGLVRAARNIPNVTVISASSVNPYIVLNNQKIILLPSSLETFKNK